jgi:hypothetical protein
MVFELTVKGHTTHEIKRILHVTHGTVCRDMKEIRQRAKQVVANYFNETLPLRSLQETLHNRIIQKKGEIESHNRACIFGQSMDRDINNRMGLGSNTYAAATLTSHIKRISLSNIF